MTDRVATQDETSDLPELPAEGTAAYRSLTDSVIAEFRERGGAVGGMLDGLPLLLLTTTGAKSGLPRTNPVTFLTDPEHARLVVVAAKAGDVERHPDWFYNLSACPHATVELGREMFPIRATPLIGEERQRLLARFAAELPPAFADYLDKPRVQVPVIALDRSR